MAVLEEFNGPYPAPASIRADRPAFIAQVLANWCDALAIIGSACISQDPHERTVLWKRSTSDCAMSFLKTEPITNALEAQILIDRWRWESNFYRSQSALQVLTPLEAAQH